MVENLLRMISTMRQQLVQLAILIENGDFRLANRKSPFLCVRLAP